VCSGIDTFRREKYEIVSIGKALEESHCLVAVWSYFSVNFDWVKEEADEAKQKGILVQLFLDAVVYCEWMKR